MIVGFAGRIASGKSSVSKGVAAHYKIPLVSFGDAVREEARVRGLPGDRATLQDLGQALIDAGWDAFCRRVVQQVSWDGQSPLLVDGLRHLGAVESLRRLAEPSSLFLVFIDTPRDKRYAWLKQRGASELQAIAADLHPNEGELDAVKEIADLVVPNEDELGQAVSQVVQVLSERTGPSNLGWL